MSGRIILRKKISSPGFLVFLKWTNTNVVGELNNKNLYQMTINVTVIMMLLIELWKKS